MNDQSTKTQLHSWQDRGRGVVMNKLIGIIMIVASFIYLILTPISVLIFFVFAIPATIILAFGIWFKELADLFFAGGAATRDIARSGLWLLDKGINKLKGK